MGFAITWFAVPEAHAASFIERLDLVPTGETAECPDSLISSAATDKGWHLLWYDEYSCPFLGEKDVERISLDHDLLVCVVEEHVMISSAAFWSKGQCQWLLFHDGCGGPKGLEVTGSPPDGFERIREDMLRRQTEAGGNKADVDFIFEIPLKVAQALTGFKHDEDSEHIIGNQFGAMKRTVETPVEEALPKETSWFRRWFGGGR